MKTAIWRDFLRGEIVAGPGLQDIPPLPLRRLARIIPPGRGSDPEHSGGGYISNHPAQDDGAFQTEYARLQPNRPNPFVIGTMPTVRYFDVLRECHMYVTGLEAQGKVVRHR